MNKQFFALVAFSIASIGAAARDIGEVTTEFIWVGSNHKITVEGFEDPKVVGVTCFISRAKTGGVKGMFGVAEDTSDASVACRQTGKLAFKEKIKDEEQVFSERASILFKKHRVVRFYDKVSNSLVYLVYTDKLIEGSPKNSISAVWLDSVRPPQ